MDNTFYKRYPPERWTRLTHFCYFHQPTYRFDRLTESAVRGVGGHAGKAKQLFNLFCRVVPSASAEKKVQENTETTSSTRSRDCAALVECVIGELYSSLDCMRKVLGKIYGRFRGITSDSTRKLFVNAQKGIIDDRVPYDIRSALQEATWFNEFRRIRDGLTHGETGICHPDKKTGKLDYFNIGLGTSARAHVIEDIETELRKYFTLTSSIMETVFGALNGTLKDEPVQMICGTYRGRAYTRQVSPSQAADSDGGICEADEWFEKEKDLVCPLISQCAAYNRKKNAEQGL